MRAELVDKVSKVKGSNPLIRVIQCRRHTKDGKKRLSRRQYLSNLMCYLGIVSISIGGKTKKGRNEGGLLKLSNRGEKKACVG